MYKIVVVDGEEQLSSDLYSYIPMDESNRHYKEYLEWVAEGNEPEVIPN